MQYSGTSAINGPNVQAVIDMDELLINIEHYCVTAYTVGGVSETVQLPTEWINPDYMIGTGLTDVQEIAALGW